MILFVAALSERRDGRLLGPRPEQPWSNMGRTLTLAFGLYVITYLASGLVLIAVTPSILGRARGEQPPGLIVQTIIGGAYLVVPALVTLRAVLRSDRRPTCGADRRILMGVAGGLAAFGAALGVLWVVQTIGGAVGWVPSEQSVVQRLREASGPDAAFLVFYAVAVAPFAEEVFYRGLLLPTLARRVGVTRALIVQALIFGAMHFLVAPTQMPLALPLAAVGWCAGYLYYRTGSFLCAVLVHATFNGVQLLGMFLGAGAGAGAV